MSGARPLVDADLLQPYSDRLLARRADLVLVLALVLSTLNSSGSYGFIAGPAQKAAASLLAVVVALVLLVRGTARPPSPPLIALIVVFELVLVVTSMARELPVERYVLLGGQLALSFCFLVWMCVRPQRLLGVLFTTSVVHLVLAQLIPDRFLMEDGVYRLDGGSHPIQLGFEAGAVLVVSLAAVLQPMRLRPRIVLVIIAVYAAYIANQAFSRQSLIAISVSVVILTLVIPGAFRWVRAFLGVLAAGVVVARLGTAGIASLLGADQISDLTSATGRTTIWARILDYSPDFTPLGYGYAALNDSVGPDRVVYAASFGENAENALLQVLLDGGVAGAVVWAVLLVVAVRLIVRSTGVSRIMALSFVPLLVSSVLVSSGLSGEGLQWWWFLAVATECGVSAVIRQRAPSRAPIPIGAS